MQIFFECPISTQTGIYYMYLTRRTMVPPNIDQVLCHQLPPSAAGSYLRDFLRDTMITTAMTHNAAIMIAMIIPTGMLSPVFV